MMDSTIIVGVLSFLGTVLGSFSGMKLMSYRIEQLEKRVDKHNNVIERMYTLEKKDAIQDERISELEKRGV
jgi:uncharacterized coiled-coil protein SlyX